MAKTTKYSIRKESIYQIYPRVYSQAGDLNSVTRDLDRIKDMGFTIIYLLPIHEPGLLNRKGSMGCPYSIKDYYKIDPKLGTLDDFKNLIKKTHELGMKVMMDVVINHTACDATYTINHPEYYYLDDKGNPSRKVAEWTDILDLNYGNKELREELLKMLEYWAKFGVDAYRCDVAPLVDLDFWTNAQKRLKAINENFILLAESAEEEFIYHLREENIAALTDNDLYNAFDLCYCYDIKNYLNDAFDKEYDLTKLAEVINYQQIMLSKNAFKTWFVENHDIDRLMAQVNDKDRAINFTAFTLLIKGVGFVYAGQEAYCTKRPSLFEKDDIDWSNRDSSFEKLIGKINHLKKQIFSDNEYVNLKMLPFKDILAFSQNDKKNKYLGLFDVKGLKSIVKIDIEDGTYFNQIDETYIDIKNGLIKVDRPILIQIY